MIKLMSKFCSLGVNLVKAALFPIRIILIVIIVLVVVAVAYISCQQGVIDDPDAIIELPFIEN